MCYYVVVRLEYTGNRKRRVEEFGFCGYRRMLSDESESVEENGAADGKRYRKDEATE